jgi:hypothetical protein
MAAAPALSVRNSTSKVYRVGVTRFHEFLRVNQFQYPVEPLRCTEMVHLFATALDLMHYAPVTVEGYLSHVNHDRKVRKLPPFEYSQPLKTALASFNQTAPPPPPKRDGIEKEDLQAILRATDMSSTNPRLFATLLVVLRSGAARPCEMLSTSKDTSTWLPRGNITITQFAVSIHSPYTKTKGKQGQTRFYPHSSDPMSAYQLLVSYFAGFRPPGSPQV